MRAAQEELVAPVEGGRTLVQRCDRFVEASVQAEYAYLDLPSLVHWSHPSAPRPTDVPYEFGSQPPRLVRLGDYRWDRTLILRRNPDAEGEVPSMLEPGALDLTSSYLWDPLRGLSFNRSGTAATVLFRLLTATRAGSLRTTVVDVVAKGGSASWLMGLGPAAAEIGYRLVTTSNELRRALLDLQVTAQRNAEVGTAAGYDSFASYNEDVPEGQELPYEVLTLLDYPSGLEGQGGNLDALLLAQVQALIADSRQSGVVVLAGGHVMAGPAQIAVQAIPRPAENGFTFIVTDDLSNHQQLKVDS